MPISLLALFAPAEPGGRGLIIFLFQMAALLAIWYAYDLSTASP